MHCIDYLITFHFDLKKDNLAILCVNLVKFGKVTPEFKIGKDVHPVISLKQKFYRQIISGSTGPIFTIS